MEEIGAVRLTMGGRWLTSGKLFSRVKLITVLVGKMGTSLVIIRWFVFFARRE